MEESDRALLAAWRVGDEDAGQRLYRRHLPAVARFFRDKVREDLEELIQATFLGLLEGHARLRDDGSFRGFLFGIARNHLFKHYRAKAVRGVVHDIEQVSLCDLGPTASTLIARNDQERLLLAGLVRLPLMYQLVLEFTFWEEMSLAEIAEAMDTPVGTAATRLRRAKQLLAAEMMELATSTELRSSISSGLETWARMLRDQR
jgi:RNA polymerase sigma factor (sigma-70 family)